MLTPDQIRLRLDRIPHHETDKAAAQIIALLRDVLPELAARASGRWELTESGFRPLVDDDAATR